MPYRFLDVGLLVVGLLVFWQPAQAQQVAIRGAVTRFGANQLGGIRVITRTEAVRPDRREIDYQLLAEPADATSMGAPEQIQVLGPHGVPQSLADIDGADCALQRFVVLRSGLQVALITAERGGDPAMADLSSPALVDIQVYRPQEGGDPGESSPICVAEGDAHHAGPLCETKTMQQAIDQVAAAVFSAKVQRP